jgi:hypothetical protein
MYQTKDVIDPESDLPRSKPYDDTCMQVVSTRGRHNLFSTNPSPTCKTFVPPVTIRSYTEIIKRNSNNYFGTTDTELPVLPPVTSASSSALQTSVSAETPVSLSASTRRSRIIDRLVEVRRMFLHRGVKTRAQKLQYAEIQTALNNAESLSDDQLEQLTVKVGEEAGSCTKLVGEWNLAFGGVYDNDGFI